MWGLAFCLAGAGVLQVAIDWARVFAVFGLGRAAFFKQGKGVL